MLNKRNQHKAIRKLIHHLPMAEKLNILLVAAGECEGVQQIIRFPKGHLENIYKRQYLKLEVHR